MRTTLAIDDDVLAAARSLAERQNESVGTVLSALARQGCSAPRLAPPVRATASSCWPRTGQPNR